MDSNYPDPEQLAAFADDPMPFHQILPHDLELLEDGTARCGAANVEYRYAAEYINVEIVPEKWERVTDISYFDMSHEDAWDDAEHVSIEEDYIIARGVPSDHRIYPYEAYWILETIAIERPS